MKVLEDIESRPHKAVSFVVERDKEVQEWNEQVTSCGCTVLSVHVHCTEDVVQCVWSSASSRVLLRLLCGWGAAEGLTRKVCSLPTLSFGRYGDGL